MAVRSALKSPMPHPVLAIRPVTERLIASSTERRSSRAVMSWLVRLSAASSSARCTISACSRMCPTAEASGRATSISTSTSASVKARGSWWTALRVPITSPWENRGTTIAERMPRRDKISRLTGGTEGSDRSSTRRGIRRSATQAASVSAGARRRSPPSGSPAARAAMSRTRISSRSRSNRVTLSASKRTSRPTASATVS